MAYSVKVTASAEKDLDSIIGYLVNELCNRQAAIHLLDEIKRTYQILSETPLCYPACTQPLLHGYRKTSVLRYVLLYRVNKDTVFVERFFSQLEDYVHKL